MTDKISKSHLIISPTWHVSLLLDTNVPEGACRQVVLLSTSVNTWYCDWLWSIRTFKSIFKLFSLFIEIINRGILRTIQLCFPHIEIYSWYLAFDSNIIDWYRYMILMYGYWWGFLPETIVEPIFYVCADLYKWCLII